MPIDIDRVLGAGLAETRAGWDPDRVILYHLGIGAGVPPTDPRELGYTYEADLRVLPSFATIPAFPSMMGVTAVPGLDVTLALLLHGEQDVRLHRPIPVSASVVNRGRIVAIHDKGTAAVVVVEVETADAVSGEVLFTNRSSLFVRGEGGFGGASGPSTTVEDPARPPDHVVESPTLPQQALLYRLSGDKNPLHVDPGFAALGGFDRPILHGLCSFGIVCKAAVEAGLGGRVESVGRYAGRFAGVVFPGETIVTSIWDQGDRLVLAAATRERGTPVLRQAFIEKTAPHRS
jgi:acyl dehydratase